MNFTRTAANGPLGEALGSLPDFESILTSSIKLMIWTALVLLGWWIINRLTTAFDDHEEIITGRNYPFAIIRMAMVISQAIATAPLVGAKSDNATYDLGWLVGGGLAVIFLLSFVIQPFMSWVVVGKPGDANALRKVSLAHAIIMGSYYIAIGLILKGCFTGSAPNITIGLMASALYAVLGFITLVAATRLISKPRRLREDVRKNNPSAAIILSSIIIGLGFILSTAIAGDFKGWIAGLTAFGLYAVCGSVALAVLLPMLDQVFTRDIELVGEVTEKDQWVPALILAVGIFAAAFGISSIQLL